MSVQKVSVSGTISSTPVGSGGFPGATRTFPFTSYPDPKTGQEVNTGTSTFSSSGTKQSLSFGAITNVTFLAIRAVKAIKVYLTQADGEQTIGSLVKGVFIAETDSQKPITSVKLLISETTEVEYFMMGD